MTVLYPLTDAPRRLPTVPGEQTLLTDDDLARSFAPDGRLGGLVAAYADRAPPGSPVRAATCLAIDPDLVATAAAMRQGYLVRAADGTTAPGTGAAVGGRRGSTASPRPRAAAASSRCPSPTPTSVALARANLGDLARRAVTDGRTVVADTLGTPVLDGTTWPADGVLDEPGSTRPPPPGAGPSSCAADVVDGGPGDATSGWCRSPGRGRRRRSPS